MIGLEKKFKALGHHVRLTIYRALRREKLCVCEITELLNMSQPAVSQHLTKLREANLIESERYGQWTFYHLSKNSFQEAIDELFDDTTSELRQKLETIKAKNLCDLRGPDGYLQR